MHDFNTLFCRVLGLVSIGAAALVSVGCGDDVTGAGESGDTTSGEATGAPLCVPGRTEACSCADGSLGAQTCTDAGDGFGACECGTESPTTSTTGVETTSSGPGTTGGSTSGGGTSSEGSSSSSGAPLAALGDPCEADGECTSQACSDGFCCDAPCTGVCDVCAWDLGAIEDGACTPAPFTSTASQACPAALTCDGSSSECTAYCVDTPLSGLPNAPADFVFIIDNSGSMSEEIQAVASNINVNLAQALDTANVDAQVVMLTRHGPTGVLSGPDYMLCVAPPLSGTTNCNAAPVEIEDEFAHYSIGVASHDGLCIALDTLYGPNSGGESDTFGMHPDGWDAVLRPEALKVFVPISDDNTVCTQDGITYDDGDSVPGGEAVAAAWIDALLAASPAQFGSLVDPRWVMHSIVGLSAKLDPADPYTPDEEIVTGTCPQGVDAGTGYQALSRASEGLRFSSCAVASYGSMFQAIVTDTVARLSENACDYTLPPAPDGQTLDLARMRAVISVPKGDAVELQPVADAEACGATSFYVEDGLARLCPLACSGLAFIDEPTFTLQAMCE